MWIKTFFMQKKGNNYLDMYTHQKLHGYINSVLEKNRVCFDTCGVNNRGWMIVTL